MDLFSTQPGIVSGFSGTAGQARSEASYETSISGLNVMGSVNVTRDGINNSASAASNLAGLGIVRSSRHSSQLPAWPFSFRNWRAVTPTP